MTYTTNTRLFVIFFLFVSALCKVRTTYLDGSTEAGTEDVSDYVIVKIKCTPSVPPREVLE